VERGPRISNPPAPLTPPDCDLRGFRDLPFDVQRFRDSDLVTEEEPEVVLAAILLWGAAWHQVPAGSLPNDDRSLSRFAGYGRSLRDWREVRDGALRGFVLCSDGRLYHVTLSEKANESWDKRLKYQHEKARDRHYKAVKHLAREDRPEFPDFDDWRAGRTPAERPNRQPRLPLERANDSDGKRDNSVGTAPPSAHPPARTAERPRAPARTESPPNPEKPNDSRKPSDGNGPTFRRNDPAIPTENALKGREEKRRESIEENPDPFPSHSNTASAALDRDLGELHAIVCEASGFRPINPTQIARSMDLVKEWRDGELDFDRVVLPAIRSVVSHSREPTRTLGRFRGAVAHEHARALASKSTGRAHSPPPEPVMVRPDEPEEMIPLRSALLERLGPSCYSIAFNEVRLEPVSMEFGDERKPLRLAGSEHAIRRAKDNYAGPLKAAAKEAGFSEVW
jgi:hypothetical protein